MQVEDESLNTEPIQPSSPPTLDPSPCENIAMSEGPQMVVIAAGIFPDGFSSRVKPNVDSDEGPQHLVAVAAPFCSEPL